MLRSKIGTFGSCSAGRCDGLKYKLGQGSQKSSAVNVSKGNGGMCLAAESVCHVLLVVCNRRTECVFPGTDLSIRQRRPAFAFSHATSTNDLSPARKLSMMVRCCMLSARWRSSPKTPGKRALNYSGRDGYSTSALYQPN